MGGGGFSGDTSVEWELHGDNVRKHDSKPNGGKGRQHTGTDETPDGPLQYFTVTIRLPKDGTERAAFISELRTELAQNRDPLVVRLPIEDHKHGGPTPGQIRVEWPSRP